jgi:protein-disulfide isomerase
MLACVVGVALAAHFADAAESTRFSSADKKAIEAIVRSYLLENPEILNEAFTALQNKIEAQGKAKASTIIAKRPQDIFADGYSVAVGNPNAAVTVVEFFDYNCAHCRRAFPTLMKLIDDKADIRFIFKEFPIFDGSEELAKAAMAAAKQGKYLAYHRALMGHEGHIGPEAIDEAAKKAGLDVAKLHQDMKDKLFAARLEANHELGDALGIDGTPSFIVGKEMLVGWSETEFGALVKKAKEKK